jgi:hypothetical protein
MAVLAVCVLLGPVARPGMAADKDKVAAKVHYETATRFFEVREYAEALKEYKAAYVAWPDPAFLFNIGQCLRKLDRNAEALDFFQQYLKKAPADDPNRPLVEERIRNIEAGLSADQDPFAKPQTAKPPPTVAPGPVVPVPAAPVSPPPAARAPVVPVAPAPPLPAMPPPPMPAPAPLPSPEPAPAPASPALTPAPWPPPAAAAPAAVQPAGADLTASAALPEEPAAPSVLTRWWFWTAVGAVVVGGTVTAIVLASRGGGTDIPGSTLGTRPVFP